MPKLSDLKHDPNNARRHNPRNVGLIESSIQRDGFGRSVLLANDGTIIAGNATIDAASSAGIEDVVVIESDGKKVIAIKRVDIEPDSEAFRNLAIADNRAAELSEWDAEILASMQNDGALSNFFYDSELEAILGDLFQREDAEEDAELDDIDDEITTTPRGELLAMMNPTLGSPRHTVNVGDKWRLGNHQLVCLGIFMDWPKWITDLQPDDILCPYAGPMVTFTKRAQHHRLFIVQPSPFICGHMLDRYVDVYGESSVERIA